jgi:hypothetical protein
VLYSVGVLYSAGVLYSVGVLYSAGVLYSVGVLYSAGVLYSVGVFGITGTYMQYQPKVMERFCTAIFLAHDDHMTIALLLLAGTVHP